MRTLSWMLLTAIAVAIPATARAEDKKDEGWIKGDIAVTGKIVVDATDPKNPQYCLRAGLTLFALEFTKADFATDAAKLEGKTATLDGKLTGKFREYDQRFPIVVIAVGSLKAAGESKGDSISGTWEVKGAFVNKKAGFAFGEVDGTLTFNKDRSTDRIHLHYDGKKEIAEAAAKLDGKAVVVAGKVEIRAIGTRSETRVLIVTKIEEAK